METVDKLKKLLHRAKFLEYLGSRIIGLNMSKKSVKIRVKEEV